MRATPVLAFFLLFVCFQPQVYAETSIKAEVDKRSITTDDLLTYKLTVSTTERNIPVLQLPDLKGWALVSQVQSSSASFRAGSLETKFIYVLVLMPGQTGKFTIAPAAIKAGGKSYTSESFQIEVNPGRMRGDGRQSPQEPEPGPDIPDTGQPKYSL